MATSAVVMELKFERMCRACMSDDGPMVPLFDGAGLPAMIMAITKLRVAEDDGLPHQVCEPCANRLNAALDFKNLCEKSDAAFHEYIIERVKMSILDSAAIKEELAFDVRYDPTVAVSAADTDNFDEFLIFKNDPETGLNHARIEESEGTSHSNSGKKPAAHNGKYCCKICGIDAENSTLLNKHYRNFHEKNLDDSDDSTPAIDNEEMVTVKDELFLGQSFNESMVMYRCSVCNMIYEDEPSYDAHMIEQHSGRPLVVDAAKFKCDVCDKTFAKRKSLNQHALTHNKERPNKCSHCHKCFSRPDQLVLHMNGHAGKRRHQCPHCHKGFNMLSTLRDHLRTHSGEKPFLCSICGKGFTQNTNLKQHLMRHSATKPFGCIECNAKFVSKGELDAHVRKHTGEHPFVCDTCGTGFTTSSSLVKHKRIHTGEKPYACDICTLRFTALGTLKNHRRTHTGEKPFICTQCPRAFAQKSDLASHNRTHTGERPYVCSSCCSPFQQLSALKAHIKNCHPIVKPEEAIMILKMSPDHSNSSHTMDHQDL